jgi:hypothetical protein
MHNIACLGYLFYTFQEKAYLNSTYVSYSGNMFDILYNGSWKDLYGPV